MRNRFLFTTLMLLALHAACAEGAASSKIDSSLAPQLNELSAQDTVSVIVLGDTNTPLKLTHNYSIIKGFSAEATVSQIMLLDEDPNVRRIYADRRFRTLSEPGIKLDVSVDAIGAKALHQLNITGNGVTVAIVDTGVDYTHPDLGGCLGAGCRVKDGYDFFDNDADPQDPHGHGTHCAGIVGANGTYVGVAPEASFYALRVCNPSGTDCPESDIVAAVDWAVARNADVISISLGGFLQPNDGVGVMEYALDAAVERGVFVAVAAGNSGPGTDTILSPADSSKVVSVGNSYDRNTVSTSDDYVWGSSSRGPSAFGRVDPDVVAPGTSICSTLPGGYGCWTGTSMATPHVAGAAALLMQASPILTPLQIRSRLMQSATTLNEFVFSQGAGLINVSRAYRFTLNASLNSDDRWEEVVLPGFNATATLVVQNTGVTNVTLSFSVGNLSDSESNHALASDYFTLPSNTMLSSGVSETFDVLFNCPQNASPALYGTTLIVSSNDSQDLRIPVAISVPLNGVGVVNGTLNNFDSEAGDWVYYPLHAVGSLMNLSLAWSGSNNLDLFLYTPGGFLANSTTNASGSVEQLSLSNLSYDTYWAVVHAQYLTSIAQYNLTVGYGSNVSVSPPLWQGINMDHADFMLINDAFPKNLSLKVKSYAGDGNTSWTFNGTINAAFNDTEYYCAVGWLKSNMSLTLEEARYATILLSWSSLTELDLFLVYWNQSNETSFSRYSSQHKNTQLGEYAEEIPYADVAHYARNFFDIGVAVCNRENTTFNGSFTVNVSLYNLSRWAPASLSASTLYLASNESKNITVYFNVSSLSRGVTYEAFLMVGDYAIVPLTLSFTNPTTPTLSCRGEYSNTSSVSFNWTQSNTFGNISNYSLQVDAMPVFLAPQEYNTTDLTLTLNLTDGLYYARVRATDDAGLTSGWSNTVNTTVDTMPPTTPMPLSPAGLLKDDTVSLFWTTASDTTSGVGYYQLEVSDDPTFTSSKNATQHTGFTANTTNTNYTGDYFLDGAYYWRIKAFDRAGNSGNHSTALNFTVTTIVLNEIMPSESQWIELYNTMPKNQSLANWTLSTQANYTIADSILQEGFLLLNQSQTNLTLAASDTLSLWNPSGVLVDNVSYMMLAPNMSYGRATDGNEIWVWFNTPSPGTTNTPTLHLLFYAGWNLISLPCTI